MQNENENESSNIEDKNTQYMYNLGQTMSEGHNMSIQAIQNEIYNEEQNEILAMNQDNTKKTEQAKNKMNENIMNIHNMDMSQEVPMMPVYMPIIEEHRDVMFANSLKGINDTNFTHILSKMDSHEELMAHEVNDMFTEIKWQVAIHQWLRQCFLIQIKQRKCFLMGKCMLHLNMMKVAT